MFRGASKDMVKSGGISIYPLEIESMIYSHPDILEAAVVGAPDPQWGEALKALIVLKPGAKLDSVAATHGSGQGEQDPGTRHILAAVI